LSARVSGYDVQNGVITNYVYRRNKHTGKPTNLGVLMVIRIKYT